MFSAQATTTCRSTVESHQSSARQLDLEKLGILHQIWQQIFKHLACHGHYRRLVPCKCGDLMVHPERKPHLFLHCGSVLICTCVQPLMFANLTLLNAAALAAEGLVGSIDKSKTSTQCQSQKP